MPGLIVFSVLLVFSGDCADQPRKTIEQRFQSMLAGMYADRDRLIAAYDKATTDEEKQRILNSATPLNDYIQRMLGLAQEDPADPGARDALLWIIEATSHSDDNHPKYTKCVGDAMALLIKHHLSDEKLGRGCLLLMKYPSPNRDRFLRQVSERSPSPRVKAMAQYALARYLKSKADLAVLIPDNKESLDYKNLLDRYGKSYLETLKSINTDELYQEAESLMKVVMSTDADMKYIVGNEGPGYEKSRLKGVTLRAMAESSLTELQSMAIGKAAPEIEGTDQDSIPFRLSDYRGKVVLLTFSGNWCAPCRAMYAEERGLVERFADAPFVLLSVNTDEAVSTLKDSIAGGEMTWRCWWDGADRTISNQWNIHAFPAIFLIDQQGIIRFMGSQSNDLRERIEKLLEPVR